VLVVRAVCRRFEDERVMVLVVVSVVGPATGSGVPRTGVGFAVVTAVVFVLVVSVVDA